MDEQTSAPNGNGQPSQPVAILPPELVMQIRTLETDVLLARTQFARQVGIAFGGKRDYYDVLGYDRTLTARQYRETYARGGIAKRIVEAYPKATWRKRSGGVGVEIYEDEDPETETEFEAAVKELDSRLNIWSVLERADILAGLSTYSVILLGVANGDLESPLPKGNPKQLLYLTPFWGGGGPQASIPSASMSFGDVDATISAYDVDPKSPRFGEPEFYQLKRTSMNLPTAARRVHWSRCIHIAEGCLDDNVFGIPVLENVWNLLMDLMKVTGGGAEAFWIRANQGLHLDIDKDMKLEDAKNTLEKLKEDLEKYQHGLSRWMRTKGVTVETLGSDVANFSQSADAILKQISGSKGIPLRILTGSEQGQLASGQDAENWNSQVQDRRTSYAEPSMVRRFFNRLIEYSYLPTPKKPFQVAWPVEEEMTEPQKADLAVKLAQANATNKESGGLLYTDSEIREMAHDKKPLTDEQRKEIADRKAEDAKVALKQQQDVMKMQQSMAPEPAVGAAPAKPSNPFQKRAAQEHKYGSTQVQLPADVASVLFSIGRTIPDAELCETEGGREIDAHVTVKYGLIDTDVKKLTRVVSSHGLATLTLGKTEMFSAPTYDVIYVAVRSSDLAELNSAIEHGIECAPSDWGVYAPHATVAYVQPGVGQKYTGLNALDGVQVTVDALTLMDVDGNKTAISLVSGYQRSATVHLPTIHVHSDDVERIVAEQIVPAMRRALGDVEGHEFHGNQWTDVAGSHSAAGGTPFDPAKAYIEHYKQQGHGEFTRASASQTKKLHDAFEVVATALRDPEIGMAMYHALAGVEPRHIEDLLYQMETGQAPNIPGGTGGINTLPVKNPISGRTRVITLAAATLQEAAKRIRVLLADPDTSDFTRKLLVDAIRFNDWRSFEKSFPQTPRSAMERLDPLVRHLENAIRTGDVDTILDIVRAAGQSTRIPWRAITGSMLMELGGAGSGDFGHEGRPGEIGGSGPGGGTSDSASISGEPAAVQAAHAVMAKLPVGLRREFAAHDMHVFQSNDEAAAHISDYLEKHYGMSLDQTAKALVDRERKQILTTTDPELLHTQLARSLDVRIESPAWQSATTGLNHEHAMIQSILKIAEHTGNPAALALEELAPRVMDVVKKWGWIK